MKELTVRISLGRMKQLSKLSWNSLVLRKICIAIIFGNKKAVIRVVGCSSFHPLTLPSDIHLCRSKFQLLSGGGGGVVSSDSPVKGGTIAVSGLAANVIEKIAEIIKQLDLPSKLITLPTHPCFSMIHSNLKTLNI